MRITYNEVVARRGRAQCVARTTDSSHWDEDHLVLKPAFVGVCRSDLKELAGARHQRRDFGHEIVAQVVHSPPASLVRSGRWVVLDPHVAVERGSGFSELLVITGEPDALDRCVVPLEGSPDQSAVFVEPLACVEHALSHMPVAPGADWLILGAGHAGFLMYTSLRAQGHRVSLANRSRKRLDGLAAAGVAPEADLLRLDDVEPGSYDGVCVATAMAPTELIESAARILKPSGFLHVYGGTAPTFPSWRGCDVDRLRRGCARQTVAGPNGPVEMSGSHGARRVHFESAIARLGLNASTTRTQVGDDVRRLIGPEVSLYLLAEALNAPESFSSTTKTVLSLRDPANENSVTVAQSWTQWRTA
jgi:threonine dehydrogenase-like Zn-dependent dehydrogenase